MAKSFIVKRKQYQMPEVGKNDYFKYLEVFNGLMKKDQKGIPYDYDDYCKMADCIAMIYGYQFTAQDILEDGDIQVEDIITEFMYVEIMKNERVNKKVNKYRAAFQNGKGSKKR